MEKIEIPDVHNLIVLTFLQKIEILKPREREVITDVIELICKPIFITKN